MEYARADRVADGFRLKMAGIDFLGGLVGLLQHSDLDVRRSSLAAIATLAESGTLIYFGACKG